MKIQKGIPIPTPRSSGVSGTLRKLQVGDSFLTELNHSNRSNIYLSACRIGIKITARSEGDKLRVWRVK